MASILILSKYGEGTPLALKLAAEGHIVKMYLQNRQAMPSLLNGFKNPSMVSEPKRMAEQYDLVLADRSGLGDLLDWFRFDRGKITLGGGTFSDKLISDTDYSIKVVDTLLESTEGVQSEPVQETANLVVEGWFNGNEWARPFSLIYEYYRFMEGDKGQITPCMGTVTWPVGESNRLIDNTLERLTPLLQKVEYCGPFGICVTVDEERRRINWLRPEFGFDSTQAWCELVKTKLFDYLYGIGSQATTSVPYHNGYGISVRLSITPWPFLVGAVNYTPLTGTKVLDIPKGALPHVWLTDVMQENGNPVLAGCDGVVGCVTARGESIRECRRRAYRTVSNIVAHPDIQYRMDIGQNVESMIGLLHKWGWLDAQ
jgi:hypothetical protein